MNRHKQKKLIIFLLFISITVTSVAFAINATTSLSVTGTATVAAQKWEVVLSNSATDGYEVTNVTNVTLSSDKTSISYSCSLEETTDTCILLIPIKNNGTYDSTITITTESNNDTLLNKLSYTKTIYNDIECTTISSSPIVISKNTSKYLKITIGYPANATNGDFPEEQSITITTKLNATYSK